MENELEVVNIRLVKEPSLYSEQILDSPQAVVELMAKELLSQWQCETVKRGYDCYEKAAEVRTATGDRIAGSYHCRWN